MNRLEPTNPPRVVAILQARMSSSRLPGKVLTPLLGKPMLQLQCERIARSKLIDKLVIATSDDSSDDAIKAFCDAQQISCFRGALEDVLSRYYAAYQANPAQHIVRLTGDCPLTDPAIIDQVIALHLETEADYTSNCAPATLPDGLDVEVMRAEALSQAYHQAERPSEREHVTLYLRNHSERFNLHNYTHPCDHSGLRWTVDQAEDLALVTQVYQALYPKNAAFTTEDVLQLLERQPQLNQINADIIRNEGMIKSLDRDRELGYE